MAENQTQRKLTAILSADVKGYSKLMGDDDESTVETITAYRKIISGLIQKHQGRVVDTPGDNILAEFNSTLNAVKSAIEIQTTLEAENGKLPDNRRMEFRIGINLGDILHKDDRIYGDGVNVASRIEGLADPGGISISGTVYDQVKNKIPNRFEFVGDRQVKNISEPVRTYRVVMGSGTHGPKFNAKTKISTHVKAGLLLLLAIIAMSIVGVYYWFDMRGRSLSNTSPERSAPNYRLSHKASIAVLPFKNLSDGVDQEYFSDGITNDIITDLSKFHGLLVIASNTVFLYKGKTVSIKNVGRELGVGYIMEGSVQKVGDQVRINAQLIDAIDETHVWAQRYNRQFTNIFELQGDIVQAIVTKLAIETFQYEQARALRKKPQDLRAYDYLLRGYAYYYQRTRSTFAMANDMFSKAVELDPLYAAAYVGLGELEYGKVGYGWTEFPNKTLNKALRLGQKAIELDESNATAHSLLSSIYTFQNKYELAINEAERAIELNPNDSGSYNELGWALLWSGQVNQAINALEVSLRLDTSSPRNIWFHLGIAYYLKEDYGKAIDILEQGLTKRPDFLGYHIALAAAYARLGRREDAVREVAAVRRLDPFFKVESFGTGFRQPAHRRAITTGLKEAGLE